MKKTLPLCLLALSPLSLAIAAAIEIDGNNSQLQIHNDVPVVNIAAPNQQGISHNSYKQLNVGNEGLVLNNSTQAGESVLAGQLQANPNLSNSASLIINEVTGNQRSNIEGKVEVFGQQADVLIANPNGISVNGGSFINTPHITLTTGELGFSDVGKLASVTVKGGDITIGSKSLNGNGNQYIDIMTETMKLNGAIQGANELNVTLGQNKINLADGSVKKLDGLKGARTLALDSSALGGMYANKIRLVSTQGLGSTLGVNLPEMVAHIDSIDIHSDGDLRLNNLTANNKINIAAYAVISNWAQKTTKIRSQNDITIQVSTKADNIDKGYKSGLFSFTQPLTSRNHFSIHTAGDVYINSSEFVAYEMDIEAKNILINSEHVSLGDNYSNHKKFSANHVNITAEKNVTIKASKGIGLCYTNINANNISIVSPYFSFMNHQLKLDYDLEFAGNDHNETQRQDMLDNYLNQSDKSNIFNAKNNIDILTNQFHMRSGKLLAGNNINFSGVSNIDSHFSIVPNMLATISKQTGGKTIMSEKSSQVLQPIIKAGNDFTVNHAREFLGRQVSITAGRDLKFTNIESVNILTNSYDYCTQGGCWFYRDDKRPRYFQRSELTAGQDILIQTNRYQQGYTNGGGIKMAGTKLSSKRNIDLISKNDGIFLSFDLPAISPSFLALHTGLITELYSGGNINIETTSTPNIYSSKQITLRGTKLNARGDISLSTKSTKTYLERDGGITIASFIYKTPSAEQLFTPQLTAGGKINIKTKNSDLINEMAFFQAYLDIDGKVIFRAPSDIIDHSRL